MFETVHNKNLEWGKNLENFPLKILMKEYYLEHGVKILNIDITILYAYYDYHY